MASRKGSAKARERARFEAGLGFQAAGPDPFEREARWCKERDERREAALRAKACESKNRYDSPAAARSAIEACAEHGRGGLHSYRCPYCGGWHLTSKPPRG